jgi:hypothetical protein
MLFSFPRILQYYKRSFLLTFVSVWLGNSTIAFPCRAEDRASNYRASEYQVAQIYTSPPTMYNTSPYNTSPTVVDIRYGVYINGDNPLLLSIVQQKVEFTAAIKRYKNRNVILVGTYFDPNYVAMRISQLQALGIQSNKTDFKDGGNFEDLIVWPPNLAISSVTMTTKNSVQSQILNINSSAYLVLVDRNQVTLPEVKLFFPDAFVRQYDKNTVIQVGMSNDLTKAQQIEKNVQSKGFPARVVVNTMPLMSLPPRSPQTVPQTIPQTIPFGTPFGVPYQNYGVFNPNKAYYVKVSAQQISVSQLSQLVLLAGVPTDKIMPYNVSGDAIVLVGPFLDQPTAQSWQNRLQMAGIGNTQTEVIFTNYFRN